MKSAQRKILALTALAILWTAGNAGAVASGGNYVQFMGAVEFVVQNGEGKGTLFVTLDTAELRIIVNPATIIQDAEGGVLTMDALAGLAEEAYESGGLAVEITGRVSMSGILAGRVQVKEPASDFVVRRHITAIRLLSEDSALISLLGITIAADLGADPPTVIQMNGVDVPLAELKNGMKIEASGMILEDGTWAAGLITVLSGNKKKDLVIFEGVVTSYDSEAGILEIEVGDETKSLATFLITEDTCIKGDPVEGAEVVAIGTLNPDFTFTAKEIRVLSALEIAPDEKRLKIGETMKFTVTLLHPAETGGVTVNLSVDTLGIVELPADPLLIAEGDQTAEFEILALAAGEAIITATALGQEATAMVAVRDTTDDDTDTPEVVSIFFSPNHVKMKPNSTREVVLHIHPPHQEDITVEFESSNEEVVPVPTARVLSNGAAMFKVALQSLDCLDTQVVMITATISGESISGTAVLEVVVEVKKKK